MKHQSLSSWNDENESKNIDTTKVSMISPAGKANLFLVHENDKYYVVSSDLRAVPILVECANKPDWNDIPPAALELYSYYEDVMSFLHNSSDSIDVVNEDWNRIINRQPLLTRTSGAVAPLLGEKTLENKWNQSFSNASVNDCDKYYNKLCPTWYNADGHCGHTYVGCGAVAMAQVMWYYKFPYAAMVPDTISKNGKPSNNMRLSEYDWSIMPANVTNTTPIPHVNMIAKLMRDCGFRLKTKYKSNESTSDQFYLDNALMFFGYSHTMQHYSKILTSGWTNKVIRELQEGRPVIYNGGVDSFYSNGHIFVVDGYNGVGRFHINFGWNGMHNDYFSLDSISVTDIYDKDHDGILDTIHSNYNHWQGALFYIRPEPNCTIKTVADTIIWENEHAELNGGGLIISNREVESGQRALIYSGDFVHLTNGVHLKSGSDVHITIKDMHCVTYEEETNSNNNVPQPRMSKLKRSTYKSNLLKITPNPVNNILNIYYSKEISVITIYSLSGQPVLQTTETEINVSSLPAGMYIVRALTVDGEQLQAKFIKQ
ncbi:MAG: C10 family peptidase [Paludibacteraceae bacterium]|nr:C10 family peptidase [Paludibacteraceae bacterium]